MQWLALVNMADRPAEAASRGPARSFFEAAQLGQHLSKLTLGVIMHVAAALERFDGGTLLGDPVAENG